MMLKEWFTPNGADTEPLVLSGKSGTDEDRSKRACVETYRGIPIYYYHGEAFEFFAGSSISADIFVIAASSRSESLGDGIYVAAFESVPENIRIGSFWIRVSFNRGNTRVENPPEKVKAKFDEVVVLLKQEIDEHFNREERRKVYNLLKERKREELDSIIRERCVDRSDNP